MNEAKSIWMDGKLVPWKEANVHILTHTLHYGNGVFEGTRAYKTDKGMAIFRLKDHTKRLLNSAKIVAIDVPYAQEELEKAQIEVLRDNAFSGNTYLRPLIYLGYGAMGVYHKNAPVKVAIAAWEWGAYLGDEGLEKGIRVKTASFVRNSAKSLFGKAKASGNYLNSQMAKYEAIECGYEEALLLDDNGMIAEGSGECFFIVRNGMIITPPSDSSLESITQDSVITMAKDLGYKVERRNITRDEVYIADEAFFTGTAAEVTPIRELDARIIGSGKRGEITHKLQNAYFEVVQGRNPKYAHWLTYIN
ncbi:branched-chain amino acid transaminase [Helicobacter winghamensis]|uniref:Branched-chain-amino-acid aminotransferase n=1 Tax=Helicobacter winghamensis TaxID=157268 RepID=A0A2N3PJQ6_9HELI|nr:branched-chain amino acid transaminase [Helicobacter winghamensis]EEO26264.1 branched-chain-amino-acid transaminase [Helicobacter winghamensis ATCC BAA-430]PKT77256.1 branched-chain amino acid aminotransferase [Helicobacter winghamensis]PKT77456.1 branched-chain amino acid aminotransferase [Helicobacter winghamensis]PKT77811.1 branched-chain amino acid aminotransferase [Helicobacter winghamensis]PKT81422.1 branched-chain amino acid aminotransferase [Helicobacter winghamensis]